MKIIRFYPLTVLLCLFLLHPGLAQNKKLDKSLKKADGYYKAGNFSKALKALNKFKSGAQKLSAQNNYMLEFYIREARMNLAIGMIDYLHASRACPAQCRHRPGFRRRGLATRRRCFRPTRRWRTSLTR